MRNVEALGNGFVSVAVLAHPLGFGLVALSDVEEKDAREEKDDQQHSECGGHGLDWSNECGCGVVRSMCTVWP